METKQKLVIIGNSHATRLKFESVPEIIQKFDIFNYAKKGGSAKDLIFSKEIKNLSESDILCIWTFGNDFLEKNILVTHNPKKIHLTKFVPKSENEINGCFSYVANKLIGIRCQIIILDSPKRHLQCCTQHSHFANKVIRHYELQNRKLRNLFTNLDVKIKVFQHQKLLGLSLKCVKNNFEYAKLLKDNVHFSETIYGAIVKNLASYIMSL